MKKVFGVLLNAYPRTFRDRHEDELYAFFEDQRRGPEISRRCRDLPLLVGCGLRCGA